jgi:hypothetical protein
MNVKNFVICLLKIILIHRINKVLRRGFQCIILFYIDFKYLRNLSEEIHQLKISIFYQKFISE